MGLSASIEPNLFKFISLIYCTGVMGWWVIWKLYNYFIRPSVKIAPVGYKGDNNFYKYFLSCSISLIFVSALSIIPKDVGIFDKWSNIFYAVVVIILIGFIVFYHLAYVSLRKNYLTVLDKIKNKVALEWDGYKDPEEDAKARYYNSKALVITFNIFLFIFLAIQVFSTI